MATTRFNYIYYSPKKGDLPLSPFAVISLKSYRTDDDGRVIISPDLFSCEYEKYIDLLIDELKEIREKLKIRFSKK